MLTDRKLWGPNTPQSGSLPACEGSDGGSVKVESLNQNDRWGCSHGFFLWQIKYGFNLPNPMSFKINTPGVKCSESINAELGRHFDGTETETDSFIMSFLRLRTWTRCSLASFLPETTCFLNSKSTVRCRAGCDMWWRGVSVPRWVAFNPKHNANKC